MHPAELTVEQLMVECDQRLLRRGGPGGQHRNKVETAVALTHRPTGIQAEANERRSQVDNRRNATFRLRLALATHHRSEACVLPPSPSPLWHARALGGRMQVAVTHDDFPALLAELLDCLATCDFDLTRAAEHFQVTSSQLIKMLRGHPPALAIVNGHRRSQGLHKLG